MFFVLQVDLDSLCADVLGSGSADEECESSPSPDRHLSAAAATGEKEWASGAEDPRGCQYPRPSPEDSVGAGQLREESGQLTRSDQHTASRYVHVDHTHKHSMLSKLHDFII